MNEGPLTRGIAIPAGGKVLLGNAWASIKVLQQLYQHLRRKLLPAWIESELWSPGA